MRFDKTSSLRGGSNRVGSCLQLVKAALAAAMDRETNLVISREEWDELHASSPRSLEAALSVLRKRLPQELNLIEDDEVLYLRERRLHFTSSEGNPEVSSLHCVNVETGDLKEFVQTFLGIEGEVCTSQADDNLFARREELFAILLRGPIVSWASFDVHSHVDVLGRRYETGVGCPDREEMWVVPSRCRLEAIVTSSVEVVDLFRKEGVSTVLVSGPESLYFRSYED